MRQALVDTGAPIDAIQLVLDPSNEASQYLMAVTDCVIATGGKAMVKAAYSSGTPAYGVGPGNMQAIIDEDYDDYDRAAKDIITGRIFDYGSVCAGDQACLVKKDNKDKLVEAFRANGAVYFDDPEIVDKFRDVIFHNGLTNGALVAKSAQRVAAAAGVEIPDDANIIVLAVPEGKLGADDLLCGEKLCPVVALLTYDDFEDAVQKAKTNLLYIGTGHSANIHSNNREHIEYLANSLPTGRILVNLPGATAAGGDANCLTPTTSIGCGSWGGNSITDNLNYEYLLNIQRIAWPRVGPAPTPEEVWAD
jgi:succinate-semialdehyde dehydrogenase